MWRAILSLIVLILAFTACQSDAPSSEQDGELTPLPPPAADYEDNPYTWGFIDRDGELVIRNSFDEVRAFSEGLALVRKNGKWGYINPRGEYHLKPTFRAAWPFEDQKAKAQSDEGKFGYINPKGEWIISPDYEELSAFSGGLAAFRQAGNYGYLNTAGEVAIAPQFTKAGPFHTGQAVVQKEDLYGIINQQGNTIIDFKYKKLKPFANGLARAQEQDRYGYLAPDGSWAIPARFRQASDFNSGLAAVAEEDKWGLIDPQGNWLVAPKYEQVFYAGEERWIAALTGAYQLLDRTGAELLTRPLDEIHPFSEGRAAYRAQDFWGYLLADGSLISEPQYYLAWHFQDGLGRVATQNGLSYIDTSGFLLFSPRPYFLELRDYSEGLAPVQIYE